MLQSLIRSLKEESIERQTILYSTHSEYNPDTVFTTFLKHHPLSFHECMETLGLKNNATEGALIIDALLEQSNHEYDAKAWTAEHPGEALEILEAALTLPRLKKFLFFDHKEVANALLSALGSVRKDLPPFSTANLTKLKQALSRKTGKDTMETCVNFSSVVLSDLLKDFDALLRYAIRITPTDSVFLDIALIHALFQKGNQIEAFNYLTALDFENYIRGQIPSERTHRESEH